MKLNYFSILLASALLAGCSSPPDKTVKVGSKTYTVAEDGSLDMTQADIKEAIENGTATYIDKDGKKPYLQLTKDEFKAASADHNALYTMLDIEKKTESDDGEIVTLVKTGSLKENLDRILGEQGWDTLDYDGHDFFIDSPYVVKGDDVMSVVNEVSKDFDVFFCADDEKKTVTVVPALVQKSE